MADAVATKTTSSQKTTVNVIAVKCRMPANCHRLRVSARVMRPAGTTIAVRTIAHSLLTPDAAVTRITSTRRTNAVADVSVDVSHQPRPHKLMW